MKRRFGPELQKAYDLCRKGLTYVGSRLTDAYIKGQGCRRLGRPDLHPPEGTMAYAAWCAGWDSPEAKR